MTCRNNADGWEKCSRSLAHSWLEVLWLLTRGKKGSQNTFILYILHFEHLTRDATNMTHLRETQGLKAACLMHLGDAALFSIIMQNHNVTFPPRPLNF